MKNLFYLIVITHFLVCCKNKEIETFQGPTGPNEGDTSIYNTDHYRLTKIVNFSKSDSKEPHGYVFRLRLMTVSKSAQKMYKIDP